MTVKEKHLPTQVNASPGRDIGLDGLRGFGALIVVFWHTAVVFFPTAALGIAVPETSHWQIVFYNSPAWVLLSGSFAVCLFFVISGYVLTIRYFRAPDLPGMIRRILGRWPRLAIPAAVSTICVFLFFLLLPGYRDAELLPAAKATGSFALHPTGVGTLKIDLEGLLDNLFWRPWFLPPDFAKLYNAVLWTMYIELTGSFIAMGLAIVTAAMASRRAAVGVIALSILVVLYAFPPGYGTYFAFFLVGTAIAAIDPPSKHLLGRNLAISVLALCLGFLMGGYNGTGLSQVFTHFYLTSNYIPGGVMIMGVGAVLVFLSVLTCENIGRVFSSRGMAFLGRVSFALYLMHSVVTWIAGIYLFNALPKVWPLEMRCLIAASVSVAASVAVAAVMTRLVDEPSIAFARRLAGRQVPAENTICPASRVDRLQQQDR